MVTLFGFEIKRKQKGASSRSGYALTEEDRESGYALRQLRTEQKRMQQEIALLREQARLEDARADLEETRRQLYGEDEEDDDGFSPEALLAPLLLKALSPTPNTEQQGIPASTVSKIHYTDEELKTLLSGVPKHIKVLAKKIDEQTIRKNILGYQPNIDEDSLQRAVLLIKQ